MDNNIYTQIGIVLIIALASKNAILIVEFARELRQQGRSILDAAVEASRLRFRPILMTSFAFILGILPLVNATGAGAQPSAAAGLFAASSAPQRPCVVSWSSSCARRAGPRRRRGCGTPPPPRRPHRLLARYGRACAPASRSTHAQVPEREWWLLTRTRARCRDDRRRDRQ